MSEQEAKDNLKDILNQGEYQVYYDDSKSFIATAIEKLQAWIIELLTKVFPSSEATGGISKIVFVVAIFVSIIILTIILVKVGRTINSKRNFRDHKPIQDIDEISWSFQRHLREAQRQESIEAYTVATRHLFLALLLNFHERNWVTTRIWKTNWEYYEELKQVNQNVAEFFYHCVLLFDQSTYGIKFVKKAEYLQFRNEAIKWLESDIHSFEMEKEGWGRIGENNSN